MPKKIHPNKTFKYWQYIAFQQRYGTTDEKYTVLSEGGDTTMRKTVTSKIKPVKTIGLFEGGHPGFKSNYLGVVEKDSVRFISSMVQLRDFIGTIDNIEEALLFARSYEYRIPSKPGLSQCRFSNGVYTLQLVGYSDSYPESLYRLNGELVEVTITQDGFLKSKHLQTYCEGRDCLYSKPMHPYFIVTSSLLHC